MRIKQERMGRTIWTRLHWTLQVALWYPDMQTFSKSQASEEELCQPCKNKRDPKMENTNIVINFYVVTSFKQEVKLVGIDNRSRIVRANAVCTGEQAQSRFLHIFATLVSVAIDQAGHLWVYKRRRKFWKKDTFLNHWQQQCLREGRIPCWVFDIFFEPRRDRFGRTGVASSNLRQTFLGDGGFSGLHSEDERWSNTRRCFIFLWQVGHSTISSPTFLDNKAGFGTTFFGCSLARLEHSTLSKCWLISDSQTNSEHIGHCTRGLDDELAAWDDDAIRLEDDEAGWMRFGGEATDADDIRLDDTGNNDKPVPRRTKRSIREKKNDFRNSTHELMRYRLMSWRANERIDLKSRRSFNRSSLCVVFSLWNPFGVSWFSFRRGSALLTCLSYLVQTMLQRNKKIKEWGRGGECDRCRKVEALDAVDVGRWLWLMGGAVWTVEGPDGISGQL